MKTREFVTEADVYSNLSRGKYPSHEKLNDERHSEPRIYETPEDLEISFYNGLAPANRYPNILFSTATHSYNRPVTQGPLYQGCAPRLTDRRTSYTGSMGPIHDNHMTDYGFAPWQRPNTVCGDAILAPTEQKSKPSAPKTNITWNKSITEGSNTWEILHV